jgi:hypothetical protein
MNHHHVTMPSPPRHYCHVIITTSLSLRHHLYVTIAMPSYNHHVTSQLPRHHGRCYPYHGEVGLLDAHAKHEDGKAQK